MPDSAEHEITVLVVDDYLAKPVNFVVLEAKLRSLTRTLPMQHALVETRRSVEKNAERPQRYHDPHVQENELTHDIKARFMARGWSDDHAS